MKLDKKPTMLFTRTSLPGGFQYPKHNIQNRLTDLSALKRQARMMKMAMNNPGDFVNCSKDLMQMASPIPLASRTRNRSYHIASTLQSRS
jgi:hypothetical protein